MTHITVYLCGSLAATGKGHKTQDVITEVIEEYVGLKCKIDDNSGFMLMQHTNGMKFVATCANG